jgi:peptide deformylase
MIRPILIHPAPILRDTSAPVPEINDRIRALLDDMLETMYDAQGRGLAAVQIGVLQRLVVIDTDWKEGARNPQFFVNPEIVWSSTTTASREERCLSIPNTPKEVIRPDRVRVRYLDRDGASQEAEMTGLTAMVIQHEVDHLEGVLILDRAA